MADHSHAGGHHGASTVDETPVSNSSVVGWGIVMLVVFFGSAAVLSSIFSRITDEELNAKVGAVGAPELVQLRAEETKRLTGYGYTDKDKQLVYIPIEEGMKQVIAEAQAPAAAPTPAVDPASAPPAGAPVGVPAAGGSQLGNAQGAPTK